MYFRIGITQCKLCVKFSSKSSEQSRPDTHSRTLKFIILGISYWLLVMSGDLRSAFHLTSTVYIVLHLLYNLSLFKTSCANERRRTETPYAIGKLVIEFKFYLFTPLSFMARYVSGRFVGLFA